MDIIHTGQRPDPQRRWEESTQPDELLAILRDLHKTELLPAALLRRFAARCACQRDSDANVDEVISALASTGAFNAAVSDLPDLARSGPQYIEEAGMAGSFVSTGVCFWEAPKGAGAGVGDFS